MFTKKTLARILSKLQLFENPKTHIEQYPTDFDVAASVLWNAYMLGDIKDKTIADLGCGTGILGIGALLLGAKYVFFLDIDDDALKIARKNYQTMAEEFEIDDKAHFSVGSIDTFSKKVEIVIQNPPFGVQQEHADRPFLLKAFEVAEIVYSLHKIESEQFIKQLSKERNFIITHKFNYSFPLKSTMDYHTHRIKRIRVGCWRLEKQKTI